MLPELDQLYNNGVDCSDIGPQNLEDKNDGTPNTAPTSRFSRLTYVKHFLNIAGGLCALARLLDMSYYAFISKGVYEGYGRVGIFFGNSPVDTIFNLLTIYGIAGVEWMIAKHLYLSVKENRPL